MKRIISLLLSILMVVSTFLPAVADTIYLPEELYRIDEESFYADTSLDVVHIPYGTEMIGTRAFGNSSVREIYIPETVQYIASDAIPSGAKIYAPSLSYALEYAKKNGNNYESFDNIVYIEYGAEKIGTYSDIHGIYIPETVTYIADNAFTNIRSGFIIYAPAGSYAYEYAFAHDYAWNDCGSYYRGNELSNIADLFDDETVLEIETIELSYISSDGIDDPELLLIIDEINGLQDDLNRSSVGSDIEKLDQDFSSFQDCFNSEDIIVNENGIAINANGKYYNAGIISAELIDSNSKIIDVQSSPDDKAVLITAQNENGDLVYIHSDENGLSFSDTVLTPRGISYGPLTARAAENQTNLISAVFSKIESFVDKVKNYVLAIEAGIDSIDARYRADEKIAAGLKKRTEELSRLYPDNQEYAKSAIQASKKYDAVVKKSKAFAVIAKNWNIISRTFDIASIIADGRKLYKVNQIAAHGHPTSEDSKESSKLQIAETLRAYITQAQFALLGNIAYTLFDIWDKVDPVLTIVSLTGGPLGIGTKLATGLTMKAAKAIVLKQFARIGAEIALDNLAENRYNAVISTDKLLHKKATPTPKPTMTPSPTPTPTLTPSPAATPTPTLIPTPSPTRTPTPSPIPTSTPDNTDDPTPTPTPTPEPTDDPSPEPSQSPDAPHVGNYVTFGSYWQNNDGTKTPLQWKVLAVDGNKALLLSRYVIDVQPYNTTRIDVTWENSTIRTWLNTTFYQEAFSSNEMNAILTSLLNNSYEEGMEAWRQVEYISEPYPDYHENNTYDRIFLLSVGECVRYLTYATEPYGHFAGLTTTATEYAMSKDASSDGNFVWLRSHSRYSCCAALLYADGTLGSMHVDGSYQAIRPAMWVNLQQITH